MPPLKPGESLILGGFKNSDENYESAWLHVDSITAEDESTQYLIQTKSINMSGQNFSETGRSDKIFSASSRRAPFAVELPPHATRQPFQGSKFPERFPA
jgi:hypothetical protein